MQKDVPNEMNSDLFNYLKNLPNSKISKIKKYTKSKRNWHKIKHKSVIYEIGDFVLITVTDEKAFYCGKIKSIIPENGIEEIPHWPCIVVQLYIFKDEIDRSLNGLDDEDKFASLSNYEVFETDALKRDIVENILCLGKLLSYKDYEANDQHSVYTFFTRARYNMTSKLLYPPISEWEPACLCHNPMNPDQLYISCDKCNRWYHPKHCSIKDEDAENIKSFICLLCQDSKSLSNK